jgi:predicted nucleotidyltransferase
MKTILKVVVGSRLHGLNKENSDYDYRGIFIHDMIDVLSPFRKVKNVSWIEGDEDNTSFELRDFCKFATYGNNTILEILWSDMIIETSDLGKELQENKHKFIDSERVYEAFRGYAASQYKKMNLFEPDKRTPKFAVAYLRVLQQAKEILVTGDMNPHLVEDKDFLLEVKYNWSEKLIPQLSEKFAKMQVELADVYANHHGKFKPDIPWIESFILKAYETK